MGEKGKGKKGEIKIQAESMPQQRPKTQRREGGNHAKGGTDRQSADLSLITAGERGINQKGGGEE